MHAAPECATEVDMFRIKIFKKTGVGFQGEGNKQDISNTLGLWSTQLKEGGVKNAAAYAENLKGISQDLASPGNGQMFAQVETEAGDAVLLGKMKEWKANIDLSEIVKHWNGPKGPVEALIGWACAKYTKVTLTAAYVILVVIYSDYGFVADQNVEKEKLILRYQRWKNYQNLLDMQEKGAGKESPMPGMASPFERRTNIIAEMREDIAKETGKEFGPKDDAVMLKFVKEKLIEFGSTTVNLTMTMTDKGRIKATGEWKENVFWRQV